MKALILFTVLVLGYSMMNMVTNNANANTYKHGFNAYLTNEGK